jgi:hypothetical protein
MANTLHLAAEGYEVQCINCGSGRRRIRRNWGVVGGRRRRQLVGAVK